MKPIEFRSNLRIINQLSISHSCSSKFPSFIFTPNHGFILGSPYSPCPQISTFLDLPRSSVGPRSLDFPTPQGSLRHLPVAHRSSTGAPGGGATALQRQGRGGSSGFGRPGKAMAAMVVEVKRIKIWGLNHVENFHRL